MMSLLLGAAPSRALPAGPFAGAGLDSAYRPCYYRRAVAKPSRRIGGGRRRPRFQQIAFVVLAVLVIASFILSLISTY